MTYRIDNSTNDAPYQGIHIFRDNKHILTFSEDDAPLPDFNADQRQRAKTLVYILNHMDEPAAEGIIECFQHAYFPRPHERIKLST